MDNRENYINKISDILRTDKDNIRKIDSHLSNITGKKDVIEKIVTENDSLVNDRLQKLGVEGSSHPKNIYDALISKIDVDDRKFNNLLNSPNLDSSRGCEDVLIFLQRTIPQRKGVFLKEEKAVEFLKNEPPQKVLDYLGYDSVKNMVEKEDLFEVYSSLRFMEDPEWMNNKFLKQYLELTPDDFEEREIKYKALDEKWNKAAEKFVRKKWHNISHLKELGVVFIIPISLDIPGELLRTLSLVAHYMHEVPFYSDMFEKIKEVPSIFSENAVSLLRGDVIDRKISESDRTLWFVVQRYLAKDDENDWRLFVPHINPEASHWLRAEESLVKMANSMDHFGEDLNFWLNLDWVGGYFKDETGNDILVSFDLVDNVMSLVKKKEMIKYLYHHQEALWNKIFMEYFGKDQLYHFLKEYLLQGYFEI